MTGIAATLADSGGAGRAERELDDALYYLRRGCRPCAQRHFDRALRYGATADQIDAVRAVASTGPAQKSVPASSP